MKGVTPPYQPWAAELYTKRKDELAKDNPDARCLPIGALQMLAHPLPKKILHTPRLLVVLHERNMEFRQIFLDGRTLPEDPQPSWYGYSTGRWEGDTLVVDTVGFRDGLWADFWGSPLTDRAQMTERIRRPRFGALESTSRSTIPRPIRNRGQSPSTSIWRWTQTCSNTPVSRTNGTCAPGRKIVALPLGGNRRN
jgi:hypothetical protein